MSMITAEHQLRCGSRQTCWVLLTKGQKWFVASIELSSGALVSQIPTEPFDTEQEALNAARVLVCNSTGLTFE